MTVVDRDTAIANLNVLHDALNRIDSDLEAFTRHGARSYGTRDARQALKAVYEHFGLEAPTPPWWVK